MTKKLRLLGALLTLSFVILLGLSSQLVKSFFEPTPLLRPRARAMEIYLASQAGHSDGILLIGILIFIFIAIPIIIKYRHLRKSS